MARAAHKTVPETVNACNDGRKVVLVVDDSRTVRASLAKMLTTQFCVIAAEDGEDGWDLLQKNPAIHLVITDINMPRLDGYGLICRIRASDRRALHNVPVIVVTSAEDDLTRERAHACGANNFIVKPVENSDLLERVNFHTEANLAEAPRVAPVMSQYESDIEYAVIATPDVDAALQLLRENDHAGVDPYAVDLALQVIPLLEYCNERFQLDMDAEIIALKAKLRTV